MIDYMNDEEATFFNWCDETVRAHISQEGTKLSRWRPRKNNDGSYELIFELMHSEGTTSRQLVPVPKQFHELLEREYFINHPDHEDDF
ncbi:hypothetical protein [Desulfoscipio gibsoniae]|uniref:Uncharacterized protein n=1 Tax=Desulfoscipio gibsoniae DSM 7213 TaxID=767817 RepID=R4KJM6_9FIRM|nr:hypothetical protein [Desulfoscipio gibsoniae]AGL01812.1 hypothetical protein Desgi_2398 [Desulfoscipio gibsoniae DSM 7213]